MGAALLSLAACSLLILTAADRPARESTQQYCGQKLTSSLSLLCDGIYYYKRTDPTSHNDVEDEDVLMGEKDQAIRDFFRGREDALTLTGHRRFRDKRQVVSECCRKGCSVSELMSYCGRKDS